MCRWVRRLYGVQGPEANIALLIFLLAYVFTHSLPVSIVRSCVWFLSLFFVRIFDGFENGYLWKGSESALYITIYLLSVPTFISPPLLWFPWTYVFCLFIWWFSRGCLDICAAMLQGWQHVSARFFLGCILLNYRTHKSVYAALMLQQGLRFFLELLRCDSLDGERELRVDMQYMFF